MKKVALVSFMMALLTGCSSEAGPFVTDVSSNGMGGLTVEKCMVNLNRAINTVEADKCSNVPVQVFNPNANYSQQSEHK